MTVSNLRISNLYFITIDKDAELISNEKELAEFFNENYVNIVDILSEEKPTSIPNSDNSFSDEINAKQTVKSYNSYQSILIIKNSINIEKSFDLPKGNVEKINKIIQLVNNNKATGADSIPANVENLSADIIDSHLCNIISKDICQDRYSEKMQNLWKSDF